MKKKDLKTIILVFVAIILINISEAFAATRYSIGLDSSLMNTYLAEDESQNQEIVNMVNAFIYSFITPIMSDFEKEIQIIKYLL